MLKKLVSALALTSLAFGSGLCFDPYNHDYGVIDIETFYEPFHERVILNNGKTKDGDIKLVKYVAKGDKALVLMKGYGYFVVYVKCVHGKPQTKDVETVGDSTVHSFVVDLPKYPMKFGFYKNGFYTAALTIATKPPECYYTTSYYPYKLINEHKTDNAPSKTKFLSGRECDVVFKQASKQLGW